jgi:two-component system nitrate/nitrite response regulator NarL
MIRVLLVDDHASAREPLAILLEREQDMVVVGQAGTLADARAALARAVPDIAVVDLGMPDGDGVSLIADLRATNPDAAILVLTAETERRRFAQAVEAGASGILNKAASLDEVLGALRRLAAGESLLSARELLELLELLRLAGREREQSREAEVALSRLTAREQEVLQGIAEGLSDKEIAERLFISGKTVRAHVASILAKLGVESRLQALLFAARHGAVEI